MEAIKTVGLIINIFKKPIIEIGLQVIQLLNARQVRTIAIGEEADTNLYSSNCRRTLGKRTVPCWPLFTSTM